MRRWVAAALGLLASCGGSSDPGVDAARPIDAPKADAACVTGCDPLSATACAGTERCTWIVDASQARGGDTACLPGGAIAVGLPCMRDASGGDNCVKGATCYMDTCRRICDLDATSSTCGTSRTCQPAAMMFAACTGTTPIAGLCLP